MKKLSFALLAIVISVSFLFGCAKKAVDTSLPPLDQMVAHLENVAKMLEENKDNPEKAAELIKKYSEDNKAAIEELTKTLDKMEEDGTEEEKAKMKADAMGKVMPVMGRIMAAGADPKIQEALKGLKMN